MIWQDVGILAINLGFGFTLVPQIRDIYRYKTKLNLTTCLLTVAMLSALGLIYLTLNLWLGVLGDTIDVIMWSILLVLSARYAENFGKR